MNPWFLLAGVLFVAGAFGSGYLAGGRHERQAAQARERAAVVAAVDEGNRIASADLARAVDAERKRQSARGVAVERSVQIEERIRTEVVYRDPECRVDPLSLRMLNAAITGDTRPDPDPARRGDDRVQPAVPARRPEPGGAAPEVP